MENEGLLTHLFDIKERLARIETGQEGIKIDVIDAVVASTENRAKLHALEVKQAALASQIKTEREVTLRSAKGYSIIITTIISAIIGGVLKWFGSNH